MSTEMLCWALLAAASVGTAWCAYQASLWSGEETQRLVAASVAQFASMRRTTIANRNMTIDVGTFTAYVEADLHHDEKMTRFVRDHARPELKPALEAWIADSASGDPDLVNPFARPEYRLADLMAADALDSQAASHIAVASEANRTSDTYMLHTVLFALSLFFLGARSEARRRGMRRVTLIFGALVFTLTVVSVVRVPRRSAPRLGLRVSSAAAPASG